MGASTWVIMLHKGMGIELDLSTGSREALPALMTEQQTTIGRLEQRVAALETRLNTRSGPGMPGNKPVPTRRAPRRGACKRREHGFSRVRMSPTQQVKHALEICPDCGRQLSGGWIHRMGEVIEDPVVPVQVTEHVVMARVCPICQSPCVPNLSLDDVVAGKQRPGVNLVSLIVTLREVGRLPLRTIQWYLETVHQLHLSVRGALLESFMVWHERPGPQLIR